MAIVYYLRFSGEGLPPSLWVQKVRRGLPFTGEELLLDSFADLDLNGQVQTVCQYLASQDIPSPDPSYDSGQ